jgi:hypothetical protein
LITATVIGDIGFVGPPDSEDTVEIGTLERLGFARTGKEEERLRWRRES